MLLSPNHLQTINLSIHRQLTCFINRLLFRYVCVCVCVYWVSFLPYLLHGAPRHPAGGEPDPQLVHIDPPVLVQVQLLEEFGPETLALGIGTAVLATRPRPHDDGVISAR